MHNRSTLLAFFAGCEAFHALIHAYFACSRRTKLRGHPAELLGVRVTPGFHAGAALFNAAIAVGLGARAWKSELLLGPHLDERRSFQSGRNVTAAEG